MNKNPGRIIYSPDNPPPSIYEQLKELHQEGNLFRNRWDELLVRRKEFLTYGGHFFQSICFQSESYPVSKLHRFSWLFQSKKDGTETKGPDSK